MVQVAVSEQRPLVLLSALKMLLKNISKYNTSDFLLTDLKYNLFRQENVGTGIKIMSIGNCDE